MKPHTGFLSGWLYISIDMVSPKGNVPDSSTSRLVTPEGVQFG
jgi:hypothetical protein